MFGSCTVHLFPAALCCLQCSTQFQIICKKSTLVFRAFGRKMKHSCQVFFSFFFSFWLMEKLWLPARLTLPDHFLKKNKKKNSLDFHEIVKHLSPSFNYIKSSRWPCRGKRKFSWKRPRFFLSVLFLHMELLLSKNAFSYIQWVLTKVRNKCSKSTIHVYSCSFW